MSFEDTVFADDSQENDSEGSDTPDNPDLSEQVRHLIVEHTDVQADEIDDLVDDIIKQNFGLVTEEAALYILASQHGIEPNTELRRDIDTELQIQNIVPDMNTFCIEVEVVKVHDTNYFERDDGSKGKVRSVLVKDETGKTQISFWDEDTDVPDKLTSGDRVRIEDGYTKESDFCRDRYGCPAELRVGNNGTLTLLNDDGEPSGRLI